MVNKPKNIGTAAETAVMKYLRLNGFPNAERRALRGTYDAGDITGCDRLCFEVKAGEAAFTADDRTINIWMEQTEKETDYAKAHYGILVVRRRGKGSPGDWWAYMQSTEFASLIDLASANASSSNRQTVDFSSADDFPIRCHLSSMIKLVRKAGYGEPNDAIG